MATSKQSLLQEQIRRASISSFFIVQTCGPTKWVLKDPVDQASYRVALGERHSCSCSMFKDTCIHVLWTLIKKFKIPVDSELLLQKGLKERNISALMLHLEASAPVTVTSTAKASSNSSQLLSKGEVAQRPIGENDLCSICQENVLDNDQAIVYCRHGCGNSLHLSCMKMVADHQLKAMGHTTVTCPLCRCEFGSVEEIHCEHKKESKNRFNNRSKGVHFGSCCRMCKMSPIKGIRYRCLTCKSAPIPDTYNLCHSCFDGGGHSSHQFESRATRKSDWELPTRYIENATLAANAAAAITGRDITDNDYDLLLSLDAPKQLQGHQAMHIVNRFPLHKAQLPNPLLLSASCIICHNELQNGDVCRLLPCGHSKFHKDCIDRWLMRNSCACVQCSVPAYTCLDGSRPTQIDVMAPIYIPASTTNPSQPDDFTRTLIFKQTHQDKNKKELKKQKNQKKKSIDTTTNNDGFQVSGSRFLISSISDTQSPALDARSRNKNSIIQARMVSERRLSRHRSTQKTSLPNLLPPIQGSSFTMINSLSALSFPSNGVNTDMETTNLTSVTATNKVRIKCAIKPARQSANSASSSLGNRSISLPPLEVRMIGIART